MPVEIGFCDVCGELTCEDPDECEELREQRRLVELEDEMAGHGDVHHEIHDSISRQILTVGALRKMLEGVPYNTQVVIDDGEAWWNNVAEVIVPGTYGHPETEHSCVTFVQGQPLDTRQF